jgi:hypothetical protein
MHNLQCSHELAPEQIGQYLKKAQSIVDYVFWLVGGNEIKIKCYVNAYFAGSWGDEHDQDLRQEPN